MENLKAVIICGDRNWTNTDAIVWQIMNLPEDCLIIEGEAKGADTIAREAAILLGRPWKGFKADWNKYHKAAGPIRNAEMLKYLLQFAPDIKVLCFHSNMEESKGTMNMYLQARKAGVERQIIKE
jgi:hypothetical protein